MKQTTEQKILSAKGQAIDANAKEFHLFINFDKAPMGKVEFTRLPNGDWRQDRAIGPRDYVMQGQIIKRINLD